MLHSTSYFKVDGWGGIDENVDALGDMLDRGASKLVPPFAVEWSVGTLNTAMPRPGHGGVGPVLLRIFVLT